MKQLTKFALFNAFGNGLPLATDKVVFSVINKIEREDGSNHHYLITGIDLQGKEVTVYMTTID